MFGENFKYVLVILGMSILTYISPAMLDQISSGIAYAQEQAAVGNAIKPGFFGNVLRAEVRQSASSSFERQEGTSTRPFLMPPGQNRPANPQDIVTILFKAGIIPQDKLDQARKIVTDAHFGTSTRPLPPPPPLSATSSPSTTPM
jgi:hypothetical protein